MSAPQADSRPYRDAGVDYERLDAGKRLSLTKALSTSSFLAAVGGSVVEASRGSSAFVFEFAGTAFALVIEGLGTKSIIAEEYLSATGEDHFAAMSYDAVAAIVNDLISVGALPLVLNAYFATGNGEWYANEARYASVLEGWRQACKDAQCTWGGGESPSLPGLVAAEYIEMGGCALGALPPPTAAILGQDLAVGDEIVLCASSGLHANGASLARHLAARLPDGWQTPIEGDTTFGQAILVPTISYVPLMRALLAERIPLSYLSHITGHGLLKLMRPEVELTYRLHTLPEVPPVLRFLVEHAPLNPHAAYSTLNMGAGFAVYCAAGSGARVVEIAASLGLEACVAGVVEEGPRRVVLEPVELEFGSAELDLTPSREGTDTH